MAEENTAFYRKILISAEEHYKNGEFEDAVVMTARLLTYPNTSSNHYEISILLTAYTLHHVAKIGKTLYDILRIKDQDCSQEEIKKRYMGLKLELNPGKNKSVPVNGALDIVNYAFQILGDPVKRREYHNQLRLQNQEL